MRIIRTRHRVTGVCLAIIALASSVATANAAPPKKDLEVNVDAMAIAINGATAGGDGILIGYELTARGHWPEYRRIYREWTADSDGDAAVTLGRPIADNSFWVAFDLTTAAYGAGTLPHRRIRDAELPPGAFVRNARGQFDRLDFRGAYIYAVVVRPGAGAWELTAGDGGVNDADGGLNGRISAPARAMSRMARTASDVGAFERGDLVAIFFPRQMAYLVARVSR